MQRIEISENEPLKPGDIIELHFKAFGPTWIKAAQVALIERALENREGYRIIRSDYWQPGKVIFGVEIVKTNPVIITAAIVVGSILAVAGGAALAFGWMFEKAYKVGQTPAAVAGSVGLLIVAVIVLLSFMRK